MNPDQLDIRQVRPGVWNLEFDFNDDFIAYLKSRVPSADRSYDPETRVWEVSGDNYIPMLESIAVQKFSFVTRIYSDDKGRRIWRNVKTGHEQVQEQMFS